MKTLMTALTLTAAVALGACSDDSDDDGVLAPSSIVGDSFGLLIEDGSGAFAPEGIFTAFFETADAYSVRGDGVNVADSAGTYRYSASGDRGIIAVQDSGVGVGVYELVFSSADRGRFTSTVEADPQAQQSGTFTRQRPTAARR